MEAFPFQSNFLGMDDQGNPQYDRAVGADFIHEKEKLFFTNGIFPNPSDNFQVMAQTGMAIAVKPGACFIQGITGIEIETTMLTVERAEELTNRTDLVVLRCDFVNRLIEVAVKKGTMELTRNSNVWELKLAEITIPKMILTISQSHITDTRLSAVCGVVTGAVETVDTSTLFAQYEAAKNQELTKMAQHETVYNAWYAGFTAGAETAFNQRVTTFDAWFNENKTTIFDAIYFDFDNMIYRAGFTYSYEKADNVTTEYIKNSLTDEVYATRTNTKASDGGWTIRTVCNALNVDTTEVLTKQENGTWKCVIKPQIGDNAVSVFLETAQEQAKGYHVETEKGREAITNATNDANQASENDVIIIEV